jgi:hypothetical protein
MLVAYDAERYGLQGMIIIIIIIMLVASNREHDSS